MKTHLGYFLGLVLLCVACDSGQVVAQSPSKSNSKSKLEIRFVAEENLGSIENKLGTTAVGFAGTFDVGVRVILWRNLTDDGVGGAQARISFGSWAKEGFAVAFSGKNFAEEAFVQFTIDDCRNLIRLVERMESVNFLDPGVDIKYRDVHADYGGIRFRRFPNRPIELFVMRQSESQENNGEVWVALDAADFKKLFESVSTRLEQFNKRAATIKWK